MPRKPQRKPGQTWPGLEPGEGSPFDDDAHDGDLMDIERKRKEGGDGKKNRHGTRRRDHGDRSRDRRPPS